MLQFIELDAVLNYVSSGIREEYNIPQLMSWAYHGLSHINTIERYERIICLLEVCNHKVQLPDELVSINGVRYVPDNPMQSENCCNECIEEVKEEKECCCIFINHRLFIESQWHIKDFTPMRYMGNARSKWCKTCPDAHNISCSLTYTVDIDKMLTASTQEGWICLDYMIVPKREGKTIIPDDVNLLKGLAYYIEAMAWEDRDSRKEQGAFERGNDKLRKAEILLMKFKGKMKLTHLDITAQREMLFGRNYLLRHKILRNTRL